MAGKLTELQVKNAKPTAAKYTKAAGHGLTLIVMPDGSKYWRLRYRLGGKARMIGVGKPYPHTMLKQAQATAAEFRALIDAGVDPADRRRAEKLVERQRVATGGGEIGQGGPGECGKELTAFKTLDVGANAAKWMFSFR